MSPVTERVDGGRRRLLALVAGAPALGAVLAGMSACAADPRPKSAPGERSSLDADVKLRWRVVNGEQALLALHAATVAAHPDLAERLGPLTAHHDEHLTALRADGPLPFGAVDGPGVAPEVPGDAGSALAAVAAAESAAADACVAGCLAAAGPRLAALLASIGASEAGHGVVLA